jgi:hypothetical protein
MDRKKSDPMSLKMRFEQVPLEFVKKLLEKQADSKQKKESSGSCTFRACREKDGAIYASSTLER